MASGHLSLPPHLIPWQQHGVDYVLTDDILPPNLSIFNDEQGQRRTQLTTPRPQNMASKNHVSTKNMAGHNIQNIPSPNVARQDVAKQDMSGQNPQSMAQGIPFLPAEHWPKPWQDLMAKTAQAPVVWTYWSLGDDLSGKASTERRNFMRQILTDLGHNRGTNTFWPAALPLQEGQEPLPNLQAFWSGVSMLKSRAVVAMGQAATKAIGLPQNLRPFMQTRHNGCFVVVLRDVDLLISEPHLYGNVREFLRRSLAPFAR